MQSETSAPIYEPLSTQYIDAGLNKQYGEPPGGNYQPRRDIAERIRTRDPEDLEANAARATATIGEEYLAYNSTNTRGTGSGPIRGLLKALSHREGRRENLRRQLHEKAAQFADYFDDHVFSRFIHATGTDLGDEAVLMSPAMLAKERDVNVSETSKSSGARDVIIGNTNYVFGNSPALPSSDMVGSQHYQFKPDDSAYAVPMDIFWFPAMDDSTREEMHKRGEDAGLSHLTQYADNIFTLSAFKRLFALYNASLFDTPQAALEFYNHFYKNDAIKKAGRWDSLREGGGEERRRQRNFVWGEDMTEQEYKIACRMRDLMEQHSICPPFSVEVQCRGPVAATRTEEVTRRFQWSSEPS